MTRKSLFICLFVISSLVFALPNQPKAFQKIAKSQALSENSFDLENENVSEQSGETDPYEHFNRDMFRFNEKFDTYLLKPIASAYNDIIPMPLANGFNRMFLNLDNISNIFNDLLQANFYQAASDSWRFMINSTVGILGFFDVASKIGLNQNTQDFGLTLAKWGYKESNYLVLPFLGPKTIRDSLGIPADYFTEVYPYIKNTRLRNSLHATDIVNKRAQLLKLEGVYEQMAIDKYVFIRNAYLQRRTYLMERTVEMDDPYDNAVDSQPQKADEDYYYLDE